MPLEYHVQSAGDDAMLAQILNVRTKDGWSVERMMEMQCSGTMMVVFTKEREVEEGEEEESAWGFQTGGDDGEE